MSNVIITDNMLARFNKSYTPVTESGCWLWDKALFAHGYGSFFLTKKGGIRNIKANIASWIIHNGQIPNGLHVLHSCDNRMCVNPNHLYLGTNQQNIMDRMERGPKTGTPGERHPKARLKESDVIAIRQELAHRSTRDVAKEYGVSASTIQAIKKGRSWSHV